MFGQSSSRNCSAVGEASPGLGLGVSPRFHLMSSSSVSVAYASSESLPPAQVTRYGSGAL
jgi:hypothetical protein